LGGVGAQRRKPINCNGQIDAGYYWYTLLKAYLESMGLIRSASDHAVFVWKTDSIELFKALATDNFILLISSQALFLSLKTGLEKLFELTLQEGSILRFLNLRIIQSPYGISIDQTDHLVDSIIEPYFKDRDVSKLLSITSPFPTDLSFEQLLYEAPILVGPALRKI
jgi:hypothetical protein